MFTNSGSAAAVGPEDAAALRSNVEMLRGIGIETVTLSPSDLKTLQPFASVDDIGAAGGCLLWSMASRAADAPGTRDGRAAVGRLCRDVHESSMLCTSE